MKALNRMWRFRLGPGDLKFIAPLKQLEHGFGYIMIRSPYTPYSIYLRGTTGADSRGQVWDVAPAGRGEGPR